MATDSQASLFGVEAGHNIYAFVSAYLQLGDVALLALPQWDSTLGLHFLASANGIGWVSPKWIIGQRTNPIQDITDAKKRLVVIAGTYGRKGHWGKC